MTNNIKNTELSGILKEMLDYCYISEGVEYNITTCFIPYEQRMLTLIMEGIDDTESSGVTFTESTLNALLLFRYMIKDDEPQNRMFVFNLWRNTLNELLNINNQVNYYGIMPESLVELKVVK